MRQSSAGPSRAYLRFIGPPQLRFQDALPPPDLSVRPPAGGPPKLRAVNSNSDGGTPEVAPPKPAPPTAPAATMVARKEEVHPNPTSAPPPPPPPPPAILSDDVASKVRPEDFLPYFQFPGAEAPSNDVNAANQAQSAQAAPKTIPRSSATYQEQLQ